MSGFLCASHNVSMEWFVCAFGAEEGSCALSAVTLGGHCRVGFENNIFLAPIPQEVPRRIARNNLIFFFERRFF